MPNFFHFEGSIDDEVIDLTDICRVIKRDNEKHYMIELFGPGGTIIFFENKEERDESYENLKRTLLTS